MPIVYPGIVAYFEAAELARIQSEQMLHLPDDHDMIKRSLGIVACSRVFASAVSHLNEWCE